jgi:hypothetical protein
MQPSHGLDPGRRTKLKRVATTGQKPDEVGGDLTWEPRCASLVAVLNVTFATNPSETKSRSRRPWRSFRNA